MDTITTAVKRFRDGRQVDLARELGVSPQAVSQWVKGQRPVPPRIALQIELLTGVSRHSLRPDVFGEEVSENGAAEAQH